jgi:gentisate 1,2-dioxygenase
MTRATAKAVNPSTATEYSQRARYAIPANIFKAKRPPVPCHVFVAERDRAFADGTPTGLIALDLSARMGFDFTATTPFLLARYARIRAGESLSTGLKASGELYYAIRGSGTTQNGADRIAWQAGDVFCFPGGGETVHAAELDTVLLSFTDEPLFSYTRAAPPAPGEGPIQAVHYPAADIARELDKVRARGDIDDAAGRAVQFLNPSTEALGTCLPTVALAINSLEPGTFQRAHTHNAVALTLCIQGEGCYSMIDGQRIDWQPNAVMVTPPTAVHSHHNEGSKLMRCLIAQDGGLYYHARTVGFSFADG